MRRHWWWRPGWRPGRRLYAWHLTFADQIVSGGLADLRRVVGGRGVGRYARAGDGRRLHAARVLAYSNTDGWDEPYAAALFGIAPRSATVEFGASS